jgi:hypothetical protein
MKKIVILVLALVITASIGVMALPLAVQASPDGDNLYGIWGSSSSDIFAVGDSGIILHYNGSSWSPMGSGTTNALFGVWGSSSSDVFAAGDYGTILHYDGSSWSSMGKWYHK